MSGKSIQLLNTELTENAREHRERELLERIGARDREAMREFYLLYYYRLTRFLSILSHAIDTARREWDVFLPANPCTLVRRPPQELGARFVACLFRMASATKCTSQTLRESRHAASSRCSSSRCRRRLRGRPTCQSSVT
jgi:hypothetical protein